MAKKLKNSLISPLAFCSNVAKYQWVSGGQREPIGLDLMGSGWGYKILRVLEVKNSHKIGNFEANLASFWFF